MQFTGSEQFNLLLVAHEGHFRQDGWYLRKSDHPVEILSGLGVRSVRGAGVGARKPLDIELSESLASLFDQQSGEAARFR